MHTRMADKEEKLLHLFTRQNEHQIHHSSVLSNHYNPTTYRAYILTTLDLHSSKFLAPLHQLPSIFIFLLLYSHRQDSSRRFQHNRPCTYLLSPHIPPKALTARVSITLINLAAGGGGVGINGTYLRLPSWPK